MRKVMAIVADTSKPLLKYHCDSCENDVMIASSEVTCCPYCNESFTDKGVKVKAKVTANLQSTDSLDVVCDDCGTSLSVYNTDKDAMSFCSACYCPICGGSEMQEQSVFTEDSCNDGTCDEVKGNNDEVSEEEMLEAKQDAIEKTEQDVKNSLENPVISGEDLQWQAVSDEENGENGTLIAFSAKTGNPLFIFRKKDCSEDMQNLFGSSIMIQGFNRICASEGIGNAVYKFGGKAFNDKQVLNSNYVDSLVDEKLYKDVLPKFVECMALAVEGSIKGIYPEVKREIEDSMSNELQGLGLPIERVEAAIRSTMGTGGTTVYASLLAKAVELMKKPSEVFVETKAMITSALDASISSDPVDVEQQRVRQALNASADMRIATTPIMAGASLGSSVNTEDEISEMRKRIRFI